MIFESCILGGYGRALLVPEAVEYHQKRNTSVAVAAGWDLSKAFLLLHPITHIGPFFPYPLNCFRLAVKGELQYFRGWSKAGLKHGKVQCLHFIDSYLLIPMG